jgi:Tol biopolymer transport system component
MRAKRLGSLVAVWRRSLVLILVPLIVAAGAIPAVAGSTTRVSVDSAGGEANGFSGDRDFRRRGVSISADGRFVAFVSEASNLVPGDTNGTSDIFVHDRSTGLTTRVSVDSAGRQANGPSFIPSISADGRFVAFASDASDLVPGDTNGARDVFVHDLETGVTTRVSVNSAGGQGGGSGDPSISADGRFVAFESGFDLAPGGVQGDANIFVHDRQTGVTTHVFGFATRPSISADGRFVAFELTFLDVLGVYDRQTGVFTRIRCGRLHFFPSISANGRFVAFAADNTCGSDIFDDVLVHDLRTGVTEPVADPGFGGDGPLSISANGRFVAYRQISEVLVHDRQTGVTTQVAVDSAGGQANGGSRAPSISATGRFVAFQSIATNLVPRDTNGTSDIFVHDREDDGDDGDNDDGEQ